jgi:hypothetical protein
MKNIDELFRQCGAMEIQDTRGYGDFHGGYQFTKEGIEKFAELIVRECAGIALREDHDPFECIMNHFGIEP